MESKEDCLFYVPILTLNRLKKPSSFLLVGPLRISSPIPHWTLWSARYTANDDIESLILTLGLAWQGSMLVHSMIVPFSSLIISCRNMNENWGFRSLWRGIGYHVKDSIFKEWRWSINDLPRELIFPFISVESLYDMT